MFSSLNSNIERVMTELKDGFALDKKLEMGKVDHEDIPTSISMIKSLDIAVHDHIH